MSAAALATSTPDEITAHADEVIAKTRADLVLLREAEGEAALDLYDEVIARLDDARRLSKVITQMHPQAPMRLSATAAEQALDKVMTELSLDESIYRKLTSVDVSAMDSATQHWVGKVLSEFRRAGVDRSFEVRSRAQELRDELVGIAQEFMRNINSDTRSIAVPPSALEGLPADYVAAHPAGEDGLVRITTDYSDYLPFMSYSRSTDAREQLWRSFLQRAYPSNMDTLRRMLERRFELATLLGFESWAHLATDDKMIGNPRNAADFIAKISAAAQNRMHADYATLLERKQRDEPEATEVRPWELTYLLERVQTEQFAFDSLAMRPYFEYSRVKAGLMDVAAKLFGVSFSPRPDVPVWHDEVDVFDVLQDGEPLGQIFLDMHPRADKFSHAAMFSLQQGKGGRRLPQCVLLCNFPRAGGLMQTGEVTTFFHEFGHLLHHVFAGAQRWTGIAGVKTEWDFAEAPSQLLEEWTRDAATLARFAVHHETGEVLPAEMVARMRAADEFGKGIFVRQQMAYADLSLSLYSRDPAEVDPLALERETRARHLPYSNVDGVYMHLSFGHLEGYSAIYYTYMWSLVIAKDLFTAFDQADLLAGEASSRYRKKVLEAGGSAPAAQLVRDFLGRESTFDAYQIWLDS
ncbi:Zn-dependent oligopeptidase [Rhizocola hellebori]|uniref:Zn-dependent oligopeptidase n=1 Tax=Rhizocola hellebori TaxID=1392758 RepID=A0A8J3QHF7_9ACTN|nr:M3 family metallopeptidase [Rhizocola hellebori]GIH09682.1 Zn-dependent oligopeptidase [Rhizocola hellebori]